MFKFVILAVAATAVAAAPSHSSALLASSHIGAPISGYGLGLGSSLLTTPYAATYGAPLATSTLGLSTLGLGLHSGLATNSLGLGYGLRSPLLTGTTFGAPLGGLGLHSAGFSTPLDSSLALRSGFGLGYGAYGYGGF